MFMLLIRVLFLSAGVVVGVDQSTAYSWPTCSHCGSDNLEMFAERYVLCSESENLHER